MTIMDSVVSFCRAAGDRVTYYAQSTLHMLFGQWVDRQSEEVAVRPVTSLVLQDNLLAPEEWNGVLELIKQNSSLETLDLRNTNVPYDILSIAQHHPALTRVYLGNARHLLWAPDTDASATEALCTFMDAPNTLTHFDFSHCLFLWQGAMGAFCRSLYINTTLTWLKMDGNVLRAHGARCMKHVIAQNTSLRVLMLRDCAMRSEGIYDIINGLSDNRTLRRLHIENNESDMHDMWIRRIDFKLYEVMLSNTTLLMLGLEMRHTTDSYQLALRTCTRHYFERNWRFHVNLHGLCRAAANKLCETGAVATLDRATLPPRVQSMLDIQQDYYNLWKKHMLKNDEGQK